MTAALSDSHPNPYVVHGRAKSEPVLRGPNSDSLTSSIMEKPHTGLDDLSENATVMLKKKDV